jgi:hypothetical protein
VRPTREGQRRQLRPPGPPRAARGRTAGLRGSLPHGPPQQCGARRRRWVRLQEVHPSPRAALGRRRTTWCRTDGTPCGRQSCSTGTWDTPSRQGGGPAAGWQPWVPLHCAHLQRRRLWTPCVSQHAAHLPYLRLLLLLPAGRQARRRPGAARAAGEGRRPPRWRRGHRTCGPWRRRQDPGGTTNGVLGGGHPRPPRGATSWPGPAPDAGGGASQVLRAASWRGGRSAARRHAGRGGGAARGREAASNGRGRGARHKRRGGGGGGAVQREGRAGRACGKARPRTQTGLGAAPRAPALPKTPNVSVSGPRP